MRIGRVGHPGHKAPVVFVDKKTAVAVDSLIPGRSIETLESGALESVRATSLDALPTINLTDVRIGSPVARPSKTICMGLNYRKHAAEPGATPPFLGPY